MLPLILKQRKGIMAICDFDRKLAADDMKVKLGENGALMRIMKTLNDYDCGYIGMTSCDKKHLSLYKEAIQETRELYGDNAPVEWVLGHLAANGQRINICDVSGIGWCEVDTREDLKNAEEKITKNQDILK
jgi:choline kinase